MSIYTLAQKLEDITLKIFKAPVFPEIVAYKNDGSPYLYKKDNFLESLAILSGDYIIDYHYFDYRYHTYEMLDQNFKKSINGKIETLGIDIELAGYGYFLTYIIFHQLLVNLYTLNKKLFKIYLDKINIDKNIILKLYLEHDYTLPYCENYHLFLERILDKNNSHKILDIVFSHNSSEAKFNSKDLMSILENFDYGDINDAYLQITTHKDYSLENKLKYLKILISSYNYTIDQEDTIYFSIKNGKKILGFYLYNLEIMGSLTKLYYSVLNLFLEKGGVKKIVVVDDPGLNERLSRRLLNK